MNKPNLYSVAKSIQAGVKKHMNQLPEQLYDRAALLHSLHVCVGFFFWKGGNPPQYTPAVSVISGENESLKGEQLGEKISDL